MQTPRRTSVVAAVATSSLLLTACGGGSSGSGDTGPAPGEPVEISIALFGTMGFDEAGLFDEYERLNPGVTIRYESTQGETNYWPALQTRLASGTGVADIQGIEVARIADVTTNQPDLWTDLRETPAGEALDGYPEWKSAAATAEDGKVLGLGTDIGPMGSRPACPPTRTRWPRRCRTGTGSWPSASGSRPPPRTEPPGTTPRADCSTQSSRRSASSTRTTRASPYSTRTPRSVRPSTPLPAPGRPA
jgi:hypothetical protein